MKLHFRIPKGLKEHVDEELLLAEAAFRKNDLMHSWHHLERAHVLGQAWHLEHTKTHWHMLLFGFRIKNAKEIVGQIPRF